MDSQNVRLYTVESVIAQGNRGLGNGIRLMQSGNLPQGTSKALFVGNNDMRWFQWNGCVLACALGILSSCGAPSGEDFQGDAKTHPFH